MRNAVDRSEHFGYLQNPVYLTDFTVCAPNIHVSKIRKPKLQYLRDHPKITWRGKNLRGRFWGASRRVTRGGAIGQEKCGPITGIWRNFSLYSPLIFPWFHVISRQFAPFSYKIPRLGLQHWRWPKWWQCNVAVSTDGHRKLIKALFHLDLDTISTWIIEQYLIIRMLSWCATQVCTSREPDFCCTKSETVFLRG